MMKHILCMAILAAIMPVCRAQEAYTAMVKDSGELAYPDKKTFAEKNDLVAASNLSVFVDTYKSGASDTTTPTTFYWSDCEVKVLDKYGAEVYFFSTIKFNSSEVRTKNPEICDGEAVVYYYSSGESDASCARAKAKFTDFSSSIGATAATNFRRITGIQIYPSAKFHSLFKNPENTIVVWRQTPTAAELDGANNKVWRPAIIQFVQ